MQRVIPFALVLAMTTLTGQPVRAPADAQAAYRQARVAYEAGKFAEARDLALKASQTDPKNPEVFLLLGRPHYQLGEQDEAVAAWKQALTLAPQEPFGRRCSKPFAADVRSRCPHRPGRGPHPGKGARRPGPVQERPGGAGPD